MFPSQPHLPGREIACLYLIKSVVSKPTSPISQDRQRQKTKEEGEAVDKSQPVMGVGCLQAALSEVCPSS